MEKGPFIHIMLVGQNTGHVMTVVNDVKFRRIEKIYLIHSPDETKATGPKQKPTLFKEIAKEAKNDIKNADPDIKVILKQISDPFHTKDTLDVIADIIDEEVYEKESVPSQKFIAINITGGTNMMAVAAMVAAGTHRTRAYYVLNKLFQKNLDSWVEEIKIPKLEDPEEHDENTKPLLYQISQMSFNWPYDIRNERKNKKIKTEIDDSIVTDWMTPQHHDDTTTEKELIAAMKKKHNWSPTKTRRWLDELDDYGYISKIKNVPTISEKYVGPKENPEYIYRTFKVSDKEFMIKIEPSGRTKIRRFQPSNA